MVTWCVSPTTLHHRQTKPNQTKPLTTPFPHATEALEAATASLSLAAQERAAKDAAKKAAKAEAAEQKHADKLAKSVVTIKRIERNKRKFVTSVTGLEAFGLELKKVRSVPFVLYLLFSFGCVWGGGGPFLRWGRGSGGEVVDKPRDIGGQGLWQEIRYRRVCDQGAERWRGDRGAG